MRNLEFESKESSRILRLVSLPFEASREGRPTDHENSVFGEDAKF